jgi:hypothetical protein
MEKEQQQTATHSTTVNRTAPRPMLKKTTPPTPKKTTSLILYASSPSNMSCSTGYNSGVETPTDKILQAAWLTNKLPPMLPLIPWWVKDKFTTFKGIANDEQTMLVNAINTMLDNPNDSMMKFIGRYTVKKLRQQV